MIIDAEGVANCRVWWIDPADAPPGCDDLLSGPERARADSFRQLAARQRFTVATALLKITVAETVGSDPHAIEIRRECQDCHRLHGRPEVVGSNINVSISHSGDLVAVAISQAGPVGVDVEQINRDVDVNGMLRFVLADSERRGFRDITGTEGRTRAFFRCWTRKESVLKATGDGLRIPMSAIALGSPNEPVRLVDFAGRPELTATAQVIDLQPAPGYVGAITVLSPSRAHVRELDGAAAMAAVGDLTQKSLQRAAR